MKCRSSHPSILQLSVVASYLRMRIQVTLGPHALLLFCRSCRALQFILCKFCTPQKTERHFIFLKVRTSLSVMKKRIHLTVGSVTEVSYHTLYHMMYHIHIVCNFLAHSVPHHRTQYWTLQSRGNFRWMQSFQRN